MNDARKFVALALAACKSKQYEEAAIFLVQASQSEGSEELAQELGAADTVVEKVEEANTAIASDEPEDTESRDDAEDDEETEVTDDDWGDEPDEDEDSVSTSARRKQTSLSHIGKVMSSAMTICESDEDDSDEDEDSEVDPDFAGETLVPASFSSVKVKTSV